MIEDFPLKLHVFPNKEIYMINNSINGVKFGDVAKFTICLNGQNDSLEVKATSKCPFASFSVSSALESFILSSSLNRHRLGNQSNGDFHAK